MYAASTGNEGLPDKRRDGNTNALVWTEGIEHHAHLCPNLTREGSSSPTSAFRGLISQILSPEHNYLITGLTQEGSETDSPERCGTTRQIPVSRGICSRRLLESGLPVAIRIYSCMLLCRYRPGAAPKASAISARPSSGAHASRTPAFRVSSSLRDLPRRPLINIRMHPFSDSALFTLGWMRMLAVPREASHNPGCTVLVRIVRGR